MDLDQLAVDIMQLQYCIQRARKQKRGLPAASDLLASLVLLWARHSSQSLPTVEQSVARFAPAILHPSPQPSSSTNSSTATESHDDCKVFVTIGAPPQSSNVVLLKISDLKGTSERKSSSKTVPKDSSQRKAKPKPKLDEMTFQQVSLSLSLTQASKC